MHFLPLPLEGSIIQLNDAYYVTDVTTQRVTLRNVTSVFSRLPCRQFYDFIQKYTRMKLK